MWRGLVFAALFCLSPSNTFAEVVQNDLDKRFTFDPRLFTALPLTIWRPTDVPNAAPVTVAQLPDGQFCEPQIIIVGTDTITEDVTITVTDYPSGGRAPAAAATGPATVFANTTSITATTILGSSSTETSASAAESPVQGGGDVMRRIVGLSNPDEPDNIRARPPTCNAAIPPQTTRAQTTLKQTVTFHVSDTPPAPSQGPVQGPPQAVSLPPSDPGNGQGKGAVTFSVQGVAPQNTVVNPPAVTVASAPGNGNSGPVTRVFNPTSGGAAPPAGGATPAAGAPPPPSIVPVTTVAGVALSLAPVTAGGRTAAPAIVIQGQTITPPPAGGAATTITASNGVAVTLSGSIVAINGQTLTVADGQSASGTAVAPYPANTVGFYIAASATASAYSGPTFQGSAPRDSTLAAGWLAALAGIVAIVF